MPAKGHTRGRQPGLAFPGYRDYCPRPRGRGRSAEGAGGVGVRGEQCMTRYQGEIKSGPAARACALPGLSPRELPLLRGSPVEGPVWLSLPGRGFPPRAPPRVISPRSGAWDDTGERASSGPAARVGLSGDIATTAPAPGRGRSAEGAGGVGDRRTVYVIQKNSVQDHLLRLRPPWALATRTPAPAREPSGRANTGFLDGEGVPSPSPSPGDIPTVRRMG